MTFYTNESLPRRRRMAQGQEEADLCVEHATVVKVGVGILQGYLRQGSTLEGAVALSISHDSHNIVVVGGNDRDMLAAVEALSFMALPVIPELKLTARGLSDVQQFAFVSVDAETL